MENVMNMVVLAILWISWCGMHSILIDTAVVGFLKKCVPSLTRYYRLVYNGLSLLTLIPLAVFTRNGTGEVIFAWEGGAILVRILLFVSALLLFYGGAKRYDFQYFIGFKQLQTADNHVLMREGEDFSDAGVFGFCRHPWYLGSLILIWSILPEYPLPLFLAVCILSIYLVVGTFLEERKIVAQYGTLYRDYQQRVSMLFPWKWLTRKVGRF